MSIKVSFFIYFFYILQYSGNNEYMHVYKRLMDWCVKQLTIELKSLVKVSCVDYQETRSI